MYGLNNSLWWVCSSYATILLRCRPIPNLALFPEIYSDTQFEILQNIESVFYLPMYLYIPHFIFFLFSPPPWLLFTTLPHRMGGYMDGSALPDPFVIQPPTVLVCSDFRNQCHNLWLSFRDTDSVSEVKRQNTYSHKANVAIYSNTMWAESISVHLCNLQYKLCCWIYSIPLKSRLMVVFIWF